MQPVGALGDVETAERHDHSGTDGGGIHPAPGVQGRVGGQHEIAHGGAADGTHCLEGVRAQHQPAAAVAGDAFRNDHVRRRIVAAERDAEAEQTDDHGHEIGAGDQQRQECHEDDHLGDEHRLAAKAVRQPAEAKGADQDAEQTGRADQAVLGRIDSEFARDQRQRHAGHEHHKAHEELAGGGERSRCATASRSSAPMARSFRRPTWGARRYNAGPSVLPSDPGC